MAAPSHYIRTIHTSFTNARASAAATGSSINSHNQTIYQHHLHQYSSYPASTPKKYPSTSSGSAPTSPQATPVFHGRRRSASIRHPPAIKFNPFADEPPLLAAVNNNAHNPSSRMTLYSQPNASHSAPAIPYTIQIPPAAPTEIQRYSTPSSSRRFNFPSSSSGSPALSNGSARQNNATRMTGALSGPNISKLVAGILLNRVHAVGKPMRRRVPSHGERPREYVKSCLSSVVSVEA